MDKQRRTLVSAATALSALACLDSLAAAPNYLVKSNMPKRLVLSTFEDGDIQTYDSSGWRGFSDRVMGGISNAEFDIADVAGKKALHLTGNVTRESNGGFIQMAYFFGNNYVSFDASEYDGVELVMYGNDEDYNIHVRTRDCRWYEQSYRHTVFVKPEWQTVRIPWSAFTPSGLKEPLNPAELQRIALVGWMREFEADIALAEMALYRSDTATA
jgi:hypothetical protein